MSMWVSKAVTVATPVSAAYREWTRFESFPQFVDGLITSGQRGVVSTRWASELDRKARTADTVITDQVLNSRVTWLATRGPELVGIVTFDHLQASRCRVILQACYAPDRVLPQVMDHTGLFHGMLARCLQRFAMVAQYRWSQRAGGPAEHGTQPGPRATEANTPGRDGKHARGDPIG